MRKYRISRQFASGQWKISHVHVLVRVTSVFEDPAFHLFVDPWRLLPVYSVPGAEDLLCFKAMSEQLAHLHGRTEFHISLLESC